MQVSLSQPPWEPQKPRPERRKRVDTANHLPRGTPWIERYFKRGFINRRELAAAQMLLTASQQYFAENSELRVKVDTGINTGNTEARVDATAQFKKLSRNVPPNLWPYIQTVVLENKALGSMHGCSGGANRTRYRGRLSEGLGYLCG